MNNIINKDINTLFLCGYPKSGTTLLLALLDNNNELNTFPEELKIFTEILSQKNLSLKKKAVFEKSGALVPGVGIADYQSGKRDYSNINAKEYLDSLKNKLSSVESDKDIFLAIMENWSNFSSNNKSKQNFKYHVEKTPLSELYIYFIKKWFPKSKIIYIVRDPRDNYLSYKKKQPKLKLEDFIFYWKKSLKHIMGNKENTLILRYEDLVSTPEDIMKTVSSFLNITYNENLLKPTRNGILWAGNSMFSNNSTKIHKQASGRYKKKLEHKNIKKIEELLFDELKYFNYKIDYAKSKKNLPIYIKLYNEIKYKIKLKKLKENEKK